MAQSGNNLALLHGLAADGADFVAGVAIFRAGGGLGAYQLGLVAQSGDNLTLLHDLLAHGAHLVAGVAVFRAGGGLSAHQLGLVTQGGQGLGAGVGIVLAFQGHGGGIGPDALGGAAGLGGDLAGDAGGQDLHMAGIPGAGEGGLGGAAAGPGPHRLAPGVAQGGQGLGAGVGVVLALEGHRGGIGPDAGALAGSGDLRHGGEGMTIGAGIGDAVGHGHVVDGEHGIGIVIALVGLLIEVEGELGIVRAEGGGNGNVGRAHEPITAYRLQIGCGPDGGPGLAAVGGGLHGHGAVVADDGLEQQVIEAQRRRLAGEVHHRGDEILILQLIAAACHRQQRPADAAHAPAAAPGIFIVIHVDAGLLGGIELGIGALVPGIGVVGTGALHGPAVAGEGLGLEVVVELHVGGRLGEQGGDGVVGGDILKGVAVHRAHALAVHQHIGDGIALLGGDGEGLGRALPHGHLTGGGDGAALTGGGGDGHIVVPLLGVQLDVVHRQGGAALTGVDKGEAQVLAVLQALGDGHLGLGLGPGGEQAGIPLQVPDLLPVLAAVAGGHDLQVAVLILHGVPIGGVEIEDHVDLGIHAADIGGAGDQPLVLLVVVVMIHGGHVVLVAVPGVQRAALALDAPVVGEPLLVEVLGPEDVGGGDGAVIVGVTLGGDGVHLGVAGVVVDDHAEGLAEAGDVILLDVAGDAGLVLAEALHTIEHLAVLDVVEHHGRHILVVGHVQAQIVPALGLGDLQVVGMRLLGVDGDGEGPGVLLVGPHAVAIGQGGLDGHGGLGVVGQLGVVGVGAVPGLDAVIFGVHTGGHDAVIVVAVDGLAHILAVLAVVHLAVGAGDGVFQALGIAQQTGVDAGEAVHKVIVVGRDGVAVRQIRNGGVVVVAQVGVHRVLAGGGEGGVHVRLGLAGGAVQRLPVIGGIHDGSLGPVAVEGQEWQAQINGIGQGAAVGGHLGQGHEALHIAAVGELGQHLPALVGNGDGDGDIGGLAGSHGHPIILAVGGEGVGEQPGASADGGELLPAAVDIGFGGVGQHQGGHVVIQGVAAGVVDGEVHGVHALHGGIVLQLQLGTLHALHGQITPGIHGVVDAHQASALLPGGIGHAVVVIDHMGGAHEQGVGHVLALGAGHAVVPGL